MKMLFLDLDPGEMNYLADRGVKKNSGKNGTRKNLDYNLCERWKIRWRNFKIAK